MIYSMENEFLKVEVNDSGAELWNIFDKQNGGIPRLWQGEKVWNERSPLLFLSLIHISILFRAA